MPLLLLKLLIPENKEPSKPGETEKSDSLVLSRSSQNTSHNLKNISLIIGREYKARVQKRGYIISTGILVVIVILTAFIPTGIEYLSSNVQTKLVVVENSATTVGGQEVVKYFDTLLNANYDNQGQLKASDSKPEYEVKSAGSGELNNLRQQVRDGKLDVLLVVGRQTSGDLSFDYYSNENSTTNPTRSNRIRAVASQLNFSDKLARLGVSQSQLAALFEQPQFKTNSVQNELTGRTQEESLSAYFVAMAGIILLFTAIINYGATVAQGVVEEKSSRVMEIMINAATPFQMMLGKIIGIGLAGFTQIGLMGIAGIAAFQLQSPLKGLIMGSNSTGTSIDISNLSVGLLALVVLYFVLGFLLYATLYAAIGSLLSRQEDVQSAMAPLTFVFLGGYFAAIFGLQAPDSLFVMILSYIPFFTPMLMLVRAALANLAWWEVPVSIVIMVVAILIFTWLAARIYRTGVLMYGQKPKLGYLWKLLGSA